MLQSWAPPCELGSIDLRVGLDQEVNCEDAEAMESGSCDGVYVGSDSHVWRGALVLGSRPHLSLAFPRIRKHNTPRTLFP